MHTTYNEHQIVVTDDLRFMVKGPLVKTEEGSYDDRRFHSVEEAQAFIDRLRAAARRAGGDKVELDMLDGHGCRFVCRGINRTSRTLLGPPENSPHDEAYPNVPWLQSLLEERVKLQNALQILTRRVYQFRVPDPRGYGRVEPEAYEGLLAALKDGYAVARSRAEALPPEETGDEKAT